ncbi:hypothetical protein F5887DRAFT_965637, partial [Amanita rubescens]
MREYRIEWSLLRKPLRDQALKLSFSDVKFYDIAESVGLEREQKLKDIGTFNLCRSRIPTLLFRSIVEDMDVFQIQYGLLPYQKNERTRSRFLALHMIFNHLMALFGFASRNLPESTIEGRVATGRFKTDNRLGNWRVGVEWRENIRRRLYKWLRPRCLGIRVICDDDGVK